MTSSVSNEFKLSIKKWVELDNKHKKIKELNSSIKKEKDKYSTYITEYIKNNNLQKKSILIKDGKINYNETKTTQSVTKKYLIEKLTELFKSNQKAEEISNYIYDKRETKTKASIKRFY
tara:strand:+ start:764 stop:1120 length:357 start_codon:yes stop_codon:yes gene_type:complete